MIEHITEGIVLSRAPYREEDIMADIFTKDLGRVEARVISGRKILSKLSGNLDLLNLVTVRIVKKNRFIVADVITEDSFSKLKKSKLQLEKALRCALVMRALLPQELPDLALWHEFLRSLKKGEVLMPTILKILGYDPRGATCDGCGGDKIKYFYARNQIFACVSCSLKFKSGAISLA